MSVIVERNGPVTTLVIARPERRNAVDRPTAQALADALREFEADDTARVAVLTGSGGNFCAGADLAAVAEDGERRNRLEAEGDGPMGPSRMQLGKPLIAAIEGYAVAGGLELALLADLRVMAEDAICGVFCRRFGVPLIDGGSVRLPLNISEDRNTAIARSLSSYRGSGVHHIAFDCADIFAAVAQAKGAGVALLEIPLNYYDDLAARFDFDDEFLSELAY